MTTLTDAAVDGRFHLRALLLVGVANHGRAAGHDADTTQRGCLELLDRRGGPVAVLEEHDEGGRDELLGPGHVDRLNLEALLLGLVGEDRFLSRRRSFGAVAGL